MAGTSLGLQVPEDESEEKVRDKEAGSVSTSALTVAAPWSIPGMPYEVTKCLIQSIGHCF